MRHLLSCLLGVVFLAFVLAAAPEPPTPHAPPHAAALDAAPLDAFTAPTAPRLYGAVESPVRRATLYAHGCEGTGGVAAQGAASDATADPTTPADPGHPFAFGLLASAIPVVKIKMPHASGDHAFINEDDYDPDVHELYEDDTGPQATEAAQALADEHGIDLSTVEGTGANGKITKSDVQAAVG